jgi:hypothetical protein
VGSKRAKRDSAAVRRTHCCAHPPRHQNSIALADDRFDEATISVPPSDCLAYLRSHWRVCANARQNAVPALRDYGSRQPHAPPETPTATPFRAVTVWPSDPPRPYAHDSARSSGTTAATPQEPTPHTRQARGLVFRTTLWPCGSNAPNTFDDEAPSVDTPVAIAD